MNSTFIKTNLSPKKLFLIDGIGALLSAFLLGVVLTKFVSIFGIPVSTLYFLALIPCFFIVYDFLCYHSKLKKPSLFLNVIAVLNICYCLLSIGFAFYHFDELTFLGWTYIILEIMIILVLATIEIKVASIYQK